MGHTIKAFLVYNSTSRYLALIIEVVSKSTSDFKTYPAKVLVVAGSTAGNDDN